MNDRCDRRKTRLQPRLVCLFVIYCQPEVALIDLPHSWLLPGCLRRAAWLLVAVEGGCARPDGAVGWLAGWLPKLGRGLAYLERHGAKLEAQATTSERSLNSPCTRWSESKLLVMYNINIEEPSLGACSANQQPRRSAYGGSKRDEGVERDKRAVILIPCSYHHSPSQQIMSIPSKIKIAHKATDNNMHESD